VRPPQFLIMSVVRHYDAFVTTTHYTDDVFTIVSISLGYITPCYKQSIELTSRKLLQAPNLQFFARSFCKLKPTASKFIHLFTHSFVHSFIHSFCSFVSSFVRSFVRSFGKFVFARYNSIQSLQNKPRRKPRVDHSLFFQRKRYMADQIKCTFCLLNNLQ